MTNYPYSRTQKKISQIECINSFEEWNSSKVPVVIINKFQDKFDKFEFFRIDSGGHDIPEAVIKRRYYAGIKNFLTLFNRRSG